MRLPTTLRPYFPGVPGSEPVLHQVWNIRAAIEHHTVIQVSPQEWEWIVKELWEEVPSSRGQWPTKELRFGANPCLIIVNSGTQDQRTLNQRNQEQPGADVHKAKLQQWRTKQ